MANRINSVFTLEDTLLAYAVGDNGLALASSDGGATWHRLTLPHYANLYTVCFPGQGAVGYACGDRGAVLLTEDGGRTWRVRNVGVSVDLRVVKFRLGPQVGFVAGDAGTVLRSADAGETWTRIAVNDPQQNANLEGVGFVDENHGWVGGWGSGDRRGSRSTSTRRWMRCDGPRPCGRARPTGLSTLSPMNHSGTPMRGLYQVPRHTIG